jgi:predicted ribosomally synthesized peptide with nif11-like leader
MTLAHGAGFHLTAEEMAQSTEELTDDDLEKVVGGSGFILKNAGYT